MKNLSLSARCRILPVLCFFLGLFFCPAFTNHALCDTGTCYVALDGSGDFNAAGVSNDDVVINSALAYAESHSIGTVHLKPGTYIVNDTIKIGNNIILEGEPGTKIKLADNQIWLKRQAMFINKDSTNNNITIRNFEVDENKWNNQYDNNEGPNPAGHEYYEMIYFTNTSSISVYGMYLHSNWSNILRLEHCSAVKYYNNTIREQGHDGMYADTSSNISVHDNNIVTSCNSGFRTYKCNYVNIYDNVISGTAGDGSAGIEIEDPAGQYTRDLNIYNNIIHDVNGSGIVLSGNYQGSVGIPTVNIHHNIIYRTSRNSSLHQGGIGIEGFSANIEFNVLDAILKIGAIDAGTIAGRTVFGSGFSVTIKNNIIYNSSSTNTVPGILNERTDTHTFVLQNNCLYNSSGAGAADIVADPLFKTPADPAYGSPDTPDYHLRSKAGRWDPVAAQWTTDGQSSPCIDAGIGPLINEPQPNGGIPDIGRYGNSSEASLSGNTPPSTWPSAPVVDSFPDSSEVPAVSIPIFSPVAGNYSSTQTISIYSATPGASIYYLIYNSSTSDTPTIYDAPYSHPLIITASAIIKAIAVKSGYAASNTAEADIIINNAPLSSTSHCVRVDGGTGSGMYTENQVITITADAAPSEKVFNKWITSYGSYLDSIYNASAQATVTASDMLFVASYKDAPHHLTITNGSGSGDYSPGAVVVITAAAAPAGKRFDRWTGDTGYLSNASLATAVISSMPNFAISLTATYTDVPWRLTVSNGYSNGQTGTNNYAAGQVVVLSANPPASGQMFNQWTGYTSAIQGSEISSPTAHFTMPASHVAITATYKTASVSCHLLTIVNGTGSNSYQQGQVVDVSAFPPAFGKTFDHWTGDTGYITTGDVHSSSISVTMPNAASTLTAVYADAVLPYYDLTVSSGSGSGSYNQNQTIAISANDPAFGKIFDKWIGDIQYISSSTAKNTTVSMPGNNVNLTATYKINTSSDATLSNITISSGSLFPAFSSLTAAYSDSVANSVSCVTVAPSAAQGSSSRITVNGIAVISGSASASLNLNAGSNTITIMVTAPDNTTTRTYTITVIRAAAAAATTYSFTQAASSGTVNAVSDIFTVTPDAPYTGTITITPSGGGLSTPITLTFSNSFTARTFTITPTSIGTVTLTPANNRGLTDPRSVTYTAVCAPETLRNAVWNYPNPADFTKTDRTTIAYTIAEDNTVFIGIYTLAGELAKTLVNNKAQSMGKYYVDWYGDMDNGNKAASGVYLYIVKAGKNIIRKKIILLR